MGTLVHERRHNDNESVQVLVRELSDPMAGKVDAEKENPASWLPSALLDPPIQTRSTYPITSWLPHCLGLNAARLISCQRQQPATRVICVHQHPA